MVSQDYACNADTRSTSINSIVNIVGMLGDSPSVPPQLPCSIPLERMPQVAAVAELGDHHDLLHVNRRPQKPHYVVAKAVPQQRHLAAAHMQQLIVAEAGYKAW